MSETDDEKYVWTIEDGKQATAIGWNIVPIYPLATAVGYDKASRMPPLYYDLMWINPALAGEKWSTDVTKHVSEMALRGLPIAVKAWAAYCRLLMENRIKKPDEEDELHYAATHLGDDGRPIER